MFCTRLISDEPMILLLHNCINLLSQYCGMNKLKTMQKSWLIITYLYLRYGNTIMSIISFFAGVSSVRNNFNIDEITVVGCNVSSFEWLYWDCRVAQDSLYFSVSSVVQQVMVFVLFPKIKWKLPWNLCLLQSNFTSSLLEVVNGVFLEFLWKMSSFQQIFKNFPNASKDWCVAHFRSL